jgi:hypothetical protein
MSIQKKSLISTLKTAKKANVASAPLTHVEAGTSEKHVGKALAVKKFGKSLGRTMGKTLGKSMAARYAKK